MDVHDKEVKIARTLETQDLIPVPPVSKIVIFKIDFTKLESDLKDVHSILTKWCSLSKDYSHERRSLKETREPETQDFAGLQFDTQADITLPNLDSDDDDE